VQHPDKLCPPEQAEGFIGELLPVVAGVYGGAG